MANKIELFLNDILIKNNKDIYLEKNKKHERISMAIIITFSFFAIYVFYYVCNEGIVESVFAKIVFITLLILVLSPAFCMAFMEKEKNKENHLKLNTDGIYIPIEYHAKEKVVGRGTNYINPEKIMFMDIDVSGLKLTKEEDSTFFKLLRELIVSDDERANVVANCVNDINTDISYMEVYKISNYINQSISNHEKIEQIKNKI